MFGHYCAVSEGDCVEPVTDWEKVHFFIFPSPIFVFFLRHSAVFNLNEVECNRAACIAVVVFSIPHVVGFFIGEHKFIACGHDTGNIPRFAVVNTDCVFTDLIFSEVFSCTAVVFNIGVVHNECVAGGIVVGVCHWEFNHGSNPDEDNIVAFEQSVNFDPKVNSSSIGSIEGQTLRNIINIEAHCVQCHEHLNFRLIKNAVVVTVHSVGHHREALNFFSVVDDSKFNKHKLHCLIVPLFEPNVCGIKVDIDALIVIVTGGLVSIAAIAWGLTHVSPQVTSSFARCSIREASDDNVVDHIVADHFSFFTVIAAHIAVVFFRV